MTVKITPVGSTEGHIQVGSGLPIEIDTAGNLSTPGNVRAAPATAAGDVVTYEQAFGVGQSWQDVSVSRAAGVTYTNTTGRPIVVQVFGVTSNVGGYYSLFVDGQVASVATYPQFAPANLGVQALVPNGSSYKLDFREANAPTWMEYR